MHASYLLDVCLTFARSCKHPIRPKFLMVELECELECEAKNDSSSLVRIVSFQKNQLCATSGSIAHKKMLNSRIDSLSRRRIIYNSCSSFRNCGMNDQHSGFFCDPRAAGISA